MCRSDFEMDTRAMDDAIERALVAVAINRSRQVADAIEEVMLLTLRICPRMRLGMSTRWKLIILCVY